MGVSLTDFISLVAGVLIEYHLLFTAGLILALVSWLFVRLVRLGSAYDGGFMTMDEFYEHYSGSGYAVEYDEYLEYLHDSGVLTDDEYVVNLDAYYESLEDD